MKASPQHQRPSVLVVDDEPVLLSLLQRVLAERYPVAVTPNGHMALSLLAEPDCAIRVVLVDLTMPGMNGAALLARLRAEFPSLILVVMSGLPPEAAEPMLQGLKPDAYLIKPVRRAALLALMDKVLPA